jgi:hypothetical protein
LSLTEFQRAFADLIASPELCLSVRDKPADALAQYELSHRERSRLEAMVRDEAMSINCTLYRVNRLTPLYSVLPLTCLLLGDRLGLELEEFWKSFDDATLQYRREAWRFGEWLLKRIGAGLLNGGPIEDAIRFELAAFEVRTAPRESGQTDAYSHPRKRLERFAYDPEQLLKHATGPLEPLSREEWILLDATGDELVVHRLGPSGTR